MHPQKEIGKLMEEILNSNYNLIIMKVDFEISLNLVPKNLDLFPLCKSFKDISFLEALREAVDFIRL